ncbi:MAG: HU family DNA-binding protein [Pseudohongiella sp.]|uniref:HU family DNA-binding protein n=1 Tax=Pseudohongiella sp. TaxID=1979412 RepID=UPI0034A08E06
MAATKPTAKTTAKPAAKPIAKKTTAITDKYTKTAILAEIAQNTELSKKQVDAVLNELGALIERHIKKRGVGEFTLPGLLKIKAVKRPAQPARKGVPNPFKPGETMDIPKKPASTRVKILPLKKLKEFAQ